MGTTRVDEVLNRDVLDEHIRAGHIRASEHPSGKLTILDYQPVVQFDRLWDNETLTCRGLIVDDAGNIVARPFRKFFNLTEPEADPIGPKFTVNEKMDGSLGILYRAPDGNLTLSTRGSFVSEQAIRGTEILRSDHPRFEPPEGVTVLFEIIYPENRIVVDYGTESKLVALGAIDHATGADVPIPANWDGEIAAVYDPVPLDELVEQMRATDSADMEGFVLVGDSGGNGPCPRVKVKYDEYVRLHRIVTGVSNLTVWLRAAVDSSRENGCGNIKSVALNLRANPDEVAALYEMPSSFDQLLENVPDEFYKWVRSLRAQLEGDVRVLLDRHRNALNDRRVREAKDRKALAAAVKTISAEENLDMSVLFGLIDGRTEVISRLWRHVRPQFARPFRADLEG